MVDRIFLYIGAGLTLVWGIAHLFPTKSVVQGFGEISADNRRIITMEWVLEGITLGWNVVGIIVLAVMNYGILLGVGSGAVAAWALPASYAVAAAIGMNSASVCRTAVIALAPSEAALPRAAVCTSQGYTTVVQAELREPSGCRTICWP